MGGLAPAQVLAGLTISRIIAFGFAQAPAPTDGPEMDQTEGCGGGWDRLPDTATPYAWPGVSTTDAGSGDEATAGGHGGILGSRGVFRE